MTRGLRSKGTPSSPAVRCLAAAAHVQTERSEPRGVLTSSENRLVEPLICSRRELTAREEDRGVAANTPRTQCDPRSPANGVSRVSLCLPRAISFCASSIRRRHLDHSTIVMNALPWAVRASRGETSGGEMECGGSTCPSVVAQKVPKVRTSILILGKSRGFRKGKDPVLSRT